MNIFIIGTAAVALVGLILAYVLVTAGKKYHVDTDERVSQVRECLRGANCGACGYAGCDTVAEKIVAGEARLDACPGNSTENIAKMAAILGKEAIDPDPQVAFVSCAGTCEAAPPKANYVGIPDCRAAQLAGVAGSACSYGCLGLGSCAAVCPQKAITVKDGVAFVNRNLCIGCGMCAKTCPRHVIKMMDRDDHVALHCSNRDRGPAVKKICSSGCIGCGICAKTCPNGAVTLENNLPTFDDTKCVGCGKCVEKCPMKALKLI